MPKLEAKAKAFDNVTHHLTRIRRKFSYNKNLGGETDGNEVSPHFDSNSRNPNRLGVCKLANPGGAEFASETGTLYTTER